MFGMKKHAAPPPQDKAAAGKPRKAPARVAVTVHLDPQQRDKFELLGGEAWLREQIAAARFESVFKS